MRKHIPAGMCLRLSKKPVIASQCAPRSKCPWGTHWRGNPFLKRINSAFFADFCLKRYGFPRRFAPRSKCPWGTPRNDRGEVYRHAENTSLRGCVSFIHLKEGTAPVATGSDRGGAYNRTCGVRRMTVVYWDRVVVLNGIVDYLLLLSAAWLSGLPLRRGRLVLWA